MLLAAAMTAAVFTGCGENNGASNQSDVGSERSGFDTSGEITVVSREDGSGTRGAFVELVGIEEKDESGESVDRTTEDANVTNNTSVMMTTVAGDQSAIGYISLGSLNDTVKAVSIDGTEATVENVENGTYKVARPFNIATKGEVTNPVAKDFINFIMSDEGQEIVREEGYIPMDPAGSFTTDQPEGSLSIAGSSSVSPVMEKLAEAYQKLNEQADVEINTSDSTTGMTSAIDGICDIGMASRELKESETGAGLVPITIAMDGIVVIVNNENPIEELTSEQVKNIYIGEITTWDEVQ